MDTKDEEPVDVIRRHIDHVTAGSVHHLSATFHPICRPAHIIADDLIHTDLRSYNSDLETAYSELPPDYRAEPYVEEACRETSRALIRATFFGAARSRVCVWYVLVKLEDGWRIVSAVNGPAERTDQA